MSIVNEPVWGFVKHLITELKDEKEESSSLSQCSATPNSSFESWLDEIS